MKSPSLCKYLYGKILPDGKQLINLVKGIHLPVTSDGTEKNKNIQSQI